jgi:WD40 repeat protein
MSNKPGRLSVDIQVTSYRLMSPEPSTTSHAAVQNLTSSIGISLPGADSPHFVYILQIRLLEPEILTFETSKRFSDLAKLDDSISALTKFLPYFPPRGAQRLLTDTHAQERMRMLNSYFHVICRMEEVVLSSEFLSFFCLEKFAPQIPQLVGEIRASDEGTRSFNISSISVSRDIIAISMNRQQSMTERVSRLLSSFLGRSSGSLAAVAEVQLWYRLPNSFLCERRVVRSFSTFITISVIFEEEGVVIFGTGDGHVAAIPTQSLFAGNMDEQSAEFLVGIMSVGPITALETDGNTKSIWVGSDDGLLQHYSFQTRKVTERMSSNAEGSSVTRIKVYDHLVLVGLSSGVVNIFDARGPDLRLVTLLQGPSTPVVGLDVTDSRLMASHTGSLVDSGEGSNTVQFWDVSEILSRGTSKLAHWGPSASPMVGSVITQNGDIAIAGRNGSVNIFTPSRTEMTHRARYIFRATGEAVSAVNENSIAVNDDALFIAGSSVVFIWKCPPHDCSEMVDISTSTVCQSVVRKNRASEPVLNRAVPHVHHVVNEDDLDSWAR